MKEPKSYRCKPKRPNPFAEGKDTSKTRHGLKSEKRVADKLGARLTIGSGAKDGQKSDATLNTDHYNFRIECKATKNASFSLKHDILEKIRREALDTGRTPVLTISFTNELGEAKQGGDYAVIPMWLFNEVFCNVT
ncbi:Holliday junction resolvase [Vibrio phage vB_VpaS_sm030]|nr:Holliday junction resolvase [Vibrio phage vB_VpaS_sm030]CAI5929922.1 Holliday junction resolvase [Vibrio phage vB_VpaS_sm030]CAI6013067.1 Holliday junction resolvase [Vibrio phage vB_VpaS_sm030]